MESSKEKNMRLIKQQDPERLLFQRVVRAFQLYPL